MPGFRRLLFATVFATAVVAGPFGGWCGAGSLHASPADTTVPVTDTTVPVTDSTFVWDLEKEPSECIGFLPKPGCGREPQQAGDRGGALQWLVFGVILTGVTTIGTVLARNVVRRDREIARRMSESD